MTYREARAKVNNAFDAVFLAIWRTIKGFIIETGEVVQFAIEAMRQAFAQPFRGPDLISHMYFVGNKSIVIIALSGVFTGLALAFQIYLGFK
ncbi:MAG TPA: hypothetical protein VM432_00315 [Bdellovibrionales bacterium]|nr:hypothetical protein [Bdellovibrionales bacterium]